MKSEIKALGEKIIEDLNLIDDYDLLNKWMIHYIAEQMHKYDTAQTEDEKRIAGEHCSDTILKFWKHRFHNPSWYPFSGYKKLYDGLTALFAEENLCPFDYLIDKPVDNNDFVERINKVKQVYRLLIEDMIRESFANSYTDCDREWINVAKVLDDGEDALILSTISEVHGHDEIVEKFLDKNILNIIEVIKMHYILLGRKKQIKTQRGLSGTDLQK